MLANRILIFIGACSVLYWLYDNAIYYLQDSSVVKIILQTIGGITLFLTLCLAIIFFVRKKFTSLVLRDLLLGTSLANATTSFVKNLPVIDKDATANLAGAIIGRIFRIGIFGIVLAMAPTLLLLIQNSKIQIQNELIGKQSVLLESQTRINRIEAVSNVLDLIAIDYDLRTELAINQLATLGSDATPVMIEIVRKEMPYSDTAWKVLFKQGNVLSAAESWHVFGEYVAHVNRQYINYNNFSNGKDFITLRQLTELKRYVNNIKYRTENDKLFSSSFLDNDARDSIIRYTDKTVYKLNTSGFSQHPDVRLFLKEVQDIKSINHSN